MAEEQDTTLKRIVEVAPPTQQQITEERKGQNPITRPDTITRPRGRSGTIPFLSTSPGSQGGETVSASTSVEQGGSGSASSTTTASTQEKTS